MAVFNDVIDKEKLTRFHTRLTEKGLPLNAWAASTAYKIGYCVLYNEKMYRCKEAHTSTAEFDETKWDVVGESGLSIDNWGTNIKYEVGDFVLYNNDLYKCIVQHTSALTWDGTKFIRLADKLNIWATSTVYNINDIVLYGNILYKCVEAHTSSEFATDIAKWKQVYANFAPWEQETIYLVNDIVLYNDNIYKCKTAHTSGVTFESAKWTQIGGATKIENWATGVAYTVNQIVEYNNILYKCLTDHTSTGFATDTDNWRPVYTSIPLWTASAHYHAGDVVINNNKVYRCKESHNATASFTVYYWDLVGERTTLKEWTAFTDYEVGEMVYYDGVIYVVGTAHRSSTIFTASNFYLLNASIENYVEDRYYPENVVVTIGGELYRCNTAHTGGFEPNFSRFTRITGRITPWWEGRVYRVNEVVSYNNALYICSTQHTATNSFSADIANWTPVKSSVKLWAASTEYLVGENVIYDNTLYICNTAHTSGSAFDITKFNFVKVLLSADTNNTLEYKADGLYQEDPEGLTAAEIKAIVDDFEPELPNDTALVLASAPAFYQREQLFTSAKTTLTVYPTWLNICGTGYILTDEHVIDLTVEASWDDNQYITASNRAGKDFYIYACHPALVSPTPIFKLSASKTVPTGYTSANSRLIGGFHCECEDVGTIAGHTLSGYSAGDIIPNSVWDLDFRAVSDNDGMAYIKPINLWGDIYLASWDGNKLVSKFGEEPVTGTTDKAMHGIMFAEEFGLVSKRLPTYDEYIVWSKGTQEGTVLSGGAPPEYTGGHYNNEGNRIISNYGLEDCCGVYFQWGSDLAEHYGTSGSNTSYWDGSSKYMTGYAMKDDPIYNPTVDTVMRGSSNGLLRRLRFGGYYGGGVSRCGTRYVSCNLFGSHLDQNVSARGFSEVRKTV